MGLWRTSAWVKAPDATLTPYVPNVRQRPQETAPPVDTPAATHHATPIHPRGHTGGWVGALSWALRRISSIFSRWNVSFMAWVSSDDNSDDDDENYDDDENKMV